MQTLHPPAERTLDVKICFSIFCMLCAFSLEAQTCYSNGLETVLSTQGQIDSFPLKYPSCKEFASNLVIQEDEVGAITNLDSLQQLERITGDLRVINNAKLSHLYGLDHLVHIGGWMEIRRNSKLVDLSGLDSLKNIVHGLSLAANASLRSLLGIDQLSMLGGGLQIVNNIQLTSLLGLENLQEIGALSILGNESLKNLKGLEHLKRINGSLNLSHTSLSDVFDLSGVRRLNGALAITHNNILRSLSGLDNIDYTTISTLSVSDNDNLSLCAVASVCAYLESGKPAHFAWNGMSDCDDTMNVVQACEKRPIAPNSNCFSNSVTFSTQDQIDSFPIIFPDCKRFLWNVTIEENKSGNITNLNSLAQIQYIGGTLTIQNNRALANLTGLDSVPYIGRNLVIENNDALLNFIGLDQIRSVGGHVSILGNNALSNFMGLDSLTSIRGRLVLRNNSSLTSLSGLERIKYATIELLVIENSPLLADCSVKSICDFLSLKRAGLIGGNARGCNSDEEVRALCTTSTSNVATNKNLQSFRIYPNPTSSRVEIELELQRAVHLNISIYDYLGRQVTEVYNGHSLPGNQIYSCEVSTFTPGLYFCRLQIDSIPKDNLACDFTINIWPDVIDFEVLKEHFHEGPTHRI